MRPEEIEELANKIVGTFTRPKTAEAACVTSFECGIEYACNGTYTPAP